VREVLAKNKVALGGPERILDGEPSPGSESDVQLTGIARQVVGHGGRATLSAARGGPWPQTTDRCVRARRRDSRASEIVKA
jgi:hypothetical protein